MRVVIKPCDTVGGAFMVLRVGKHGQAKKLAIGLTQLEAKCWKARMMHPHQPETLLDHEDNAKQYSP